MKMRLLGACLVLLCCRAVSAQSPSPVLKAMQDELSRSFEVLSHQETPPYFLSYEITESHTASVSGTFGTLTSIQEQRSRMLDIDLRVGDYALDNTRPIRGRGRRFGGRSSFARVPLDDDANAIRGVLWYHTDQAYKQAVEQLTRVQTNVRVAVEEEDPSDDFSREQAEQAVEMLRELRLDRAVWEKKIRTYTEPFARYGDIYLASARINAEVETRWYVNTDGSAVQTSQAFYRLRIFAYTKADDGMELPRFESFFSFTPEGMPDDAEILAAVAQMIQDLKALRMAPIVDPYTGPAILSGKASGVFFHEVFGHRVEGHRQKHADEGQTFKKKVGEQLLPETFSVYFDPTLERIAGTDLMGAYRYDNQGIKARRVDVIEQGVFKRFLMDRSPIEGFPNSNGHGRKQPGRATVSRQSNLVVAVEKPMSREHLKEMLIERVKQGGKPFGLYFKDIQGGFTQTGRTSPNAFNVLPIMVYRIFPDGREELVRGVDLIGTPLTAFSQIVAGDESVAVFNGVCGAESGWVPVSAVSPGLLVAQIEVQKKGKSQDRPPILPPPFEPNP